MHIDGFKNRYARKEDFLHVLPFNDSKEESCTCQDCALVLLKRDTIQHMSELGHCCFLYEKKIECKRCGFVHPIDNLRKGLKDILNDISLGILVHISERAKALETAGWTQAEETIAVLKSLKAQHHGSYRLGR